MTSNPFRVIFMGTPEFAVPSLKALLAHGENVVAVVSQPDRPKGRGRKLSTSPVKEIAEGAGIPVLQPTKIKTAEFHENLRSFKPDLIVVTAYGRILPGSLITLPRLGTINVHASLLPRYRGAAPIQWVIIRGEKKTGITIMQMDEGLDTGDILLPAELPIEPEDTAGALALKLSALGGETLATALDLLRAGKLPPVKQDDSLATLAPPLSKEDGLIDWTKSAQEISNLIRGLDPWPTAFTFLDTMRLRLFSPSVEKNDSSLPPGKIIRADARGILIATGKDALLISEVQREGARRMHVDAFLRGMHDLDGAVFS